MSPGFSVVVVTFRRPRELGLALEALERQESAPPFEVLVIDNDSQKSGERIVAPFLSRHAGWRYLPSPSNNVSLARNLGARFAEGEWLAFMDDDCVPPPAWLAQAERAAETFPKEGLLFGGPCVNDKEKPLESGPGWRELPGNRYLLEGNMFFRRAEYLALDGMSRDLGPSSGRFGYHEGSELQDRHREKFGRLHRRMFSPALQVRHLNSNPMPFWEIAFRSGLDAPSAFGGRKPTLTRWLYQFLKTLGPSIRLVPCLLLPGLPGMRDRTTRELYRLGEILGEINLGLSEAGRASARWIRRKNNRFLSGRPAGEAGAVPPPADRVVPASPTARGWMAGKIGTTELLALEFSDRWIRPPWPEPASWRRSMRRLFIDSGVFPEARSQFEQFLGTYREAIRHLDVVCAWQTDPFLREYEEALLQRHCPHAARISLAALSSDILGEIAGRRWLVVSPFTETMARQAPILAKVHTGKPWAGRLEGQAARCEYVPCPTFSFLQKSPFQNWSEGLEKLAAAVLSKEFDVALIGAGAWSLPLAARLKQAGRTAVHLGGETQLVFGIKGQRWEGYGIYNEHWVRPSAAETPAGFLQKEQGCYW